MTVNNSIPNISYEGDGVTVYFPYSFRILEDSDLKVFVDTVQQVQFSDYTLVNQTENGGEVLFIVPPGDTLPVLLIRATSKTQQVDYEPFSPFPADTTEFTVDKLTLITQELEQRFVDDVDPKVFSVFGRVGDVIADCLDYVACYAGFNHLFGSHPDVDFTQNTPVRTGQGIWFDEADATWKNRAAAEESWPTGLADGGELNISNPNPELILNGDFTQVIEPNDWTEGDAWGLGFLIAQCSGTQVATTLLEQTIPPLTGATEYVVTYTVVSHISGTVTANAGGTLGTPRTATGTFTETITSGGTGFAIEGDVDFLGGVDNVSVKLAPANDIEVIAGIGIIVNAYDEPLAPPTLLALQWAQINTPITAAPSTAGSVVWFSIADTGTPVDKFADIVVNAGELKQYAQPPNPSLAKAEIFLGVTVHNGVEWKEISQPNVINQTAATLREFIITVLGPSFIVEGGDIMVQPGFMLDQMEGVIWENNRNWHNDKSNPNREALPAALPITFQYVNRDFSDVGAQITVVDPSMWDNAGTVENIGGPANTASIQRLYIDPANNYWILWGQYTYPNFLTAQANLFAETPVIPFILQNSILLGYIISERGKSDWDLNESIFVSAGDSGGSGGGGTPITDHDNLNGLTPDNHHNQVHLLYGPDHSDVDTTHPLVAGSALVHDGTNWIGLPVFPTIGYGGIRLDTPTGMPSLGIGFEVIPADAAVVTSPVTVTQDFGNNGIRFGQEGVWNLSVNFSIEHNESNSGRQFSVQIYNATEATGTAGVIVPVARNQPGTYFSATLMVEVSNADIGDLYQIRVGGGDIITGVLVESYQLSVTHISQFVEAAPFIS
jgi:hypothetical protein